MHSPYSTSWLDPSQSLSQTSVNLPNLVEPRLNRITHPSTHINIHTCHKLLNDST